MCGCLLLNEDTCPAHVASVRVEWSPSLERAYVAVVEAVASGLSPVVTIPEAAFYRDALALSERWGRLKVVALRYQPSGISHEVSA